MCRFLSSCNLIALLLAAVLLAAGVLPAAYAQEPSSGEPLLEPVPFNAAEAIIEPFWDPAISGFPKWTIEDGSAHGLKISQNWAAVEYQWESKPESGPALRMYRDFDVGCDGYDRFLVAMVVPTGATLHITLDTDTGTRAYTSGGLSSDSMEHSIALEGATRVGRVTIELEAGENTAAAGWFTWIALQNSSLLAAYEKQYDLSGMRWETQLKPEEYEPKFEPVYDVFLEPGELESMRAEHERQVRETGTSSYLTSAERWRLSVPERGIHEFVDSGGRKNDFGVRTRDAAMPSLDGSPNMALMALVIKDKELLRLAARYALCRAVSEKWDEGFMGRFPGSSWESRSFRRGYCCKDIAEILDWAGELFTETGRIYVMRRLAEEGIGPCNYITWRFDYLYYSNQMTFFGYGRLWAYLVLEREWPRVKAYTDIAGQDLLELFRNAIMEDGGFAEPPTYFGGTITRGAEMLDRYARARGQEAGALIPDNMKSTGDYAAAIASTLPEADVIPFGDSGTKLGDSLLTLSALTPESYWVTMLRKSMAREPGIRWTYREEQKLKALPAEGPPAPALVVLPDTGLMASHREFEGQRVKLFLIGNKGAAPHDHEHEDRGSFVLEFAGEAFACDPGCLEYTDPVHPLIKQCQRHTMLVPVGGEERAHPAEKILHDVKPVGQGDAMAFHAEMEVSPGWGVHYRAWNRTWESPAPDRLVIRDRYELKRGAGVEFYWQTMLPCAIEGDKVVITGARGKAKIAIPAGCEARIDSLPYSGEVRQNRIVFAKAGQAGEISVSVRLFVTKSGE